MQHVEIINVNNYASSALKSSGVELNLFAYGDFAGGSGEVAIQVRLKGLVDAYEWVDFPSLTFKENTVRIIKLPNVPEYRVVVRNCNGVNVIINEKA